jgi:hypothetical protein
MSQLASMQCLTFVAGVKDGAEGCNEGMVRGKLFGYVWDSCGAVSESFSVRGPVGEAFGLLLLIERSQLSAGQMELLVNFGRAV